MKENNVLVCEDLLEEERYTRLAIEAKQGSIESREELYRILQSSFERIANYYTLKSKGHIENSEYLHEIYLTTERAISLYEKERGPFIYYLRALIKSNLLWLTIRLSKKQKEVTYSLEDTDPGSNLKLADIICDPSSMTNEELSLRFDLKIIDKKIKSYVRTLKPSQQKLFELAIELEYKPKEIAKILNVSTNKVYQDIRNLKQTLRFYCEKHVMLIPSYLLKTNKK